MRIPGIKNIGYCPAANVPDYYERQGAAGMPVDISNLKFTPLYLLGDGVMEVSDSNEHNAPFQKVTLSFVCLSEFKSGRYVFVVETVSGKKYLIGDKYSVPAVTLNDTTAAAGSFNGLKVSIELMALVAMYRVTGKESVYNGEGYVTFEDWRKIADATYAMKEHRHDSAEVDDKVFADTQDKVNVNNNKLAKKALKMAKAAL